MVASPGKLLPMEGKDIPGAETVELDKVVVKDDSCLEDTEGDTPEELDTEEVSTAAEDKTSFSEVIEVDSLEGGTEAESNRLMELKHNQILRNLIVIKGSQLKIKDTVIGILEESDIAVQLQHLFN